MGKYINKKMTIDSETGEIIKTVNWFGYDGFNEKGYNYRKSAQFLRVYYDAIPSNLSEAAFLLLEMIAELANEDNMLVYKVDRKSKFSNIIYKPLDKDDIFDRIRYKYGKNKFDRCWKELTKHCIKKIQYTTCKAWAINPAIISKCKRVPYWLYEEFKEYMNPYLSAFAIKKFHDILNTMEK